MTAEKNGKAKGETMKKRGKKAGAKGERSAATTETGGEWDELFGEVRKVVAIWEGMAKSLETIAARVESVRRTLWRLEEVRGYVAKGDAKAAGEAAAADKGPRGGYVPTIRPLTPEEEQKYFGKGDATAEEEGTRRGGKVVDFGAIPDGALREGGAL